MRRGPCTGPVAACRGRLAGMARGTGFSRSYLGTVETGVQRVTPAIIREYERAVNDLEGEDHVRDVTCQGQRVVFAPVALIAANEPFCVLNQM